MPRPTKIREQQSAATTAAKATTTQNGQSLRPPAYGVLSVDGPVIQTKKKEEDRKKKKGKPIQPKLMIGQAGDKYEREADAVADQVVRMSPETLQAKRPEEEEKKIRTQPLASRISPLQTDSDSSEAGTALESKLNASKSSGKPLPLPTLSFMEQAFGTDFSGVRVHTDQQATRMNEELGAKAFTLGRDIYFNKGQFQPETTAGKWLLGHELGHVVQQENVPSLIYRNSTGKLVVDAVVSLIEMPNYKDPELWRDFLRSADDRWNSILLNIFLAKAIGHPVFLPVMKVLRKKSEESLLFKPLLAGIDFGLDLAPFDLSDPSFQKAVLEALPEPFSEARKALVLAFFSTEGIDTREVDDLGQLSSYLAHEFISTYLVEAINSLSWEDEEEPPISFQQVKEFLEESDYSDFIASLREPIVSERIEPGIRSHEYYGLDPNKKIDESQIYGLYYTSIIGAIFTAGLALQNMSKNKKGMSDFKIRIDQYGRIFNGIIKHHTKIEALKKAIFKAIFETLFPEFFLSEGIGEFIKESVDFSSVTDEPKEVRQKDLIKGNEHKDLKNQLEKVTRKLAVIFSDGKAEDIGSIANEQFKNKVIQIGKYFLKNNPTMEEEKKEEIKEAAISLGLQFGSSFT